MSLDVNRKAPKSFRRPIPIGWIKTQDQPPMPVVAVQALKRPEAWINERPQAVYHLSAEHIPYNPTNMFQARRKKPGKIRVEMFTGGHRVRIICDDKLPMGVLWCDIDGTGEDVLRVAQVHVKPSGHVHIQITIAINKTPYTMYFHVFGVLVKQHAEARSPIAI